MSRSLEGKLPKGSTRRGPIPEAFGALNRLVNLPGVHKVVYERPVVLKCGRPYLTVVSVCKDGIRVRVRGNWQIQHVFIKCANPAVIKEVIERTWQKRHEASIAKVLRSA